MRNSFIIVVFALSFILAELAVAQVNFGRPTAGSYDPAKFGRQTYGGAATARPGSPAPSTGLTLNTGWNRKPAGKLKISNMAQIFAGLEASYDPKPPDVDQIIYGDINYLMPIGEALKAIKQPASASRQTVSTPGLPFNSFFYRMWKGTYSNGGINFERIVLVTDAKDQVVMVMLMQPSPKSRMFSTIHHKTGWNLFNLVHDRAKAQRSWRIHHEREQEGSNYIISSELIDNRLIPREQLRLYIPEQVAGTIAGLVQKAGR